MFGGKGQLANCIPCVATCCCEQGAQHTGDVDSILLHQRELDAYFCSKVKSKSDFTDPFLEWTRKDPSSNNTFPVQARCAYHPSVTSRYGLREQMNGMSAQNPVLTT